MTHEHIDALLARLERHWTPATPSTKETKHEAARVIRALLAGLNEVSKMDPRHERICGGHCDSGISPCIGCIARRAIEDANKEKA